MKKILILLTMLLLCNAIIFAEIKPFNKKETEVVSENKPRVEYLKIKHQIKAPEKEERKETDFDAEKLKTASYNGNIQSKKTETDFITEREKLREKALNEQIEETVLEEKIMQDKPDKQQEKTNVNKNKSNGKKKEVKKEINKQQKVKKQINNKTTINQCLNCRTKLLNNMYSCPQCGIAIDWEKVFLKNKIMITEKLKNNKYKCVNCGKKISKYSYTCPKCKTIIDWETLFL